jgi:GSH-dependent disulfide-bond oxidoreductase
MVDLYGMSSPNVVKITIMLEEVELAYRQHFVNVFAGDQYSPQFLAMNPNNKVPVIVDQDGPGGAPLAVFESGAILLYLAEKTCRLLPTEPAKRSTALQWLMIQLTSVGPMFGQLVHFMRHAPPGNEYSLQRYGSEVRRIFGMLENRLAKSAWLGGEEYSVADIATWPWIRTACAIFPWLATPAGGLALREWPAIRRWFDAVGCRPPVKSGVQAGERFIEKDVAAFGAAEPDALDRFFNRGRHAR